ncbi:uncharacterized protein LOC127573434 isoform X4 [Pristis pectinata]|uniref:uncharacterized protein LOC127573434 isoform X4 n=1 Tax=Pristis pectinata TaxID=685728 RepID=UPI00223D524A|nr:uncharacterized protein LOC127573434 isoform X4 [Pristis pectinata]
MEKQICSVLALILFLDLTDSLTLTVPEEVKGLLRKSVTIPCTYRPSAQYTNVVVTWYINRNDILISRDETGDYIPRSSNRDRISINQRPGDVSLVVKNLAYSDQGTYTCEVKWLFVNGSNKMQKSSGVNLIVVRGYPSITSPVILFPQVLPRSADSLTLTVPEEVTGLLRKSVTIPCTYRPSAQYTNVAVTWYINRNDILISRDETGDYIPRSINRDRISINQRPGDASLVMKNLAYSDRGIYTCEVKWLFVNGSNKMQKSSGVNLIVVRALPSTRAPASLTSKPISAVPSTRPAASLTSNPSSVPSTKPAASLTSNPISALPFTRSAASLISNPIRADSLTLTVPEEVTGLLRKSVTIPCTYRPSAQYTNVAVTWYINRNDILISRDETGDYIPRSINRDRISINQRPGDASLVMKNLAYSDRGIYTCEVKWLFVNGSNKMQKSSGVNLIVVRALPSTRAPASLTSKPISAVPSTKPAASSTSNPISGYNNVKIPAWVFVLTIILIILFFSAIITFILCRTRTKTEHIYEFTSFRYENFPHQEPVNLVSSESNEYETMTKMRPNGFQMESACASG